MKKPIIYLSLVLCSLNAIFAQEYNFLDLNPVWIISERVDVPGNVETNKMKFHLGEDTLIKNHSYRELLISGAFSLDHREGEQRLYGYIRQAENKWYYMGYDAPSVLRYKHDALMGEIKITNDTMFTMEEYVIMDFSLNDGDTTDMQDYGWVRHDLDTSGYTTKRFNKYVHITPTQKVDVINFTPQDRTYESFVLITGFGFTNTFFGNDKFYEYFPADLECYSNDSTQFLERNLIEYPISKSCNLNTQIKEVKTNSVPKFYQDNNLVWVNSNKLKSYQLYKENGSFINEYRHKAIDITKLPKGIYLLKANVDNEWYTYRFKR